MSNRLEFFFDCSSPWTYLAFCEIENLSNRIDCELLWKPILVGGVFNTNNPSVYESRINPVKVKLQYANKDMADWCKVRGIEINWPKLFPINSVMAMRGSFLAIEEQCLPEYSRKIFEAYWRDGKDISSKEVLESIVATTHMKPEIFMEFIKDSRAKKMLKENTQELVDRGGFGSPTILLNNSDMYFGNDRLHLIEKIMTL